MTTETPQAEIAPQPNAPAPVIEAAPTPAPVSGAPSGDFAAELAQLRAALKEANKESAARRKKIEEFEAAQLRAAESELSETDKLKKANEGLKAQLTEARAQLRAHERRQEFRQVSEELRIAWAGAQAESDAFNLSGLAASEEADVRTAVKELSEKRKYLLAQQAAAPTDINAQKRNGQESTALTPEQKRELAAKYGVNQAFIN